MSASRGLHPGLAINLFKIDWMSSLACQLLKIEHLRAAVSFAERVNIVYVSKNSAGLESKLVHVTVSQIISCHQAAVHISHPGFDVSPKLELMTILGNFDQAELASPIVDILE